MDSSALCAKTDATVVTSSYSDVSLEEGHALNVTSTGSLSELKLPLEALQFVIIT